MVSIDKTKSMNQAANDVIAVSLKVAQVSEILLFFNRHFNIGKKHV